MLREGVAIASSLLAVPSECYCPFTIQNLPHPSPSRSPRRGPGRSFSIKASESSAIHGAVRSGRLPLVEALLQKGFNPNLRDREVRQRHFE